MLRHFGKERKDPLVIDLQFRYGANNVPRLSNNEIEKHTLLLLNDYHDGELLVHPQALDVDDFVEQYAGLNIDFADLSKGHFIWGRMVFNNTLVIVWDNEAHQADERPVDANTIVIDNSLLKDGMEHIYRSTTMHECGHSIYHDEYFCLDNSESPQSLLQQGRCPYTRCKEQDVIGAMLPASAGKKRKLYSDHEWLEHHAKYFSAAMLMNKKAMAKLCHSKASKEFCFDGYPHFVNDALIYLVSERFNVSPSSAKIRLQQLSLYLPGADDDPSSFYCSGSMRFSPVFH